MPRLAAVLACALLLPLVDVAARAADVETHSSSLERGRRDLPLLALTFDGGGDAGDTERILDILDEKGARATFFLTGAFVRRNPALARRMAEGGHEVGNHTWTHPHLTTWDRNRRQQTLPGVTRERLQRELLATAAAFEEAAGRPMDRLWRAPYGEVNPEILRWAAGAGWRHVGWSRDDSGGRRTLDSLDWVADRGDRNYLTSAQMAARILSYDEAGDGLNGGIVLLHLNSRRVDPSVTRLAELIDALRGRGYELVTAGELGAQERQERGQIYLTQLR